MARNIDLLSGYIPATIHLFHQGGSAELKLQQLAGLIQANDLPYLQIPFYLAALLFLVKSSHSSFLRRSSAKSPGHQTVGQCGSAEEGTLNLALDTMLQVLPLPPQACAT